MNQISKLFATAACLLLASNAVTWWLATRREPTPTEQASLCEAELESIEQERDSLQEQLHTRSWSAAQQEHPVPCIAPSPPAATPEPNAALRAAFAAAKARAPVLSVEQREFMARRRYGQLFEELQLSQPQIDVLLRTLAQQEQRAAAASQAPNEGAERERNQAEVAAAIGADKAAQFERLKQTLSARSELRQVRDQLEELGQPLSDEQYRQLTTIVSAQPPNPPPSAVTGEAPMAGIERLRNWFSERDRRFRQASAAVLSADQHRSLEQGEAVRKAMSPLPSLALSQHMQAGSGG